MIKPGLQFELPASESPAQVIVDRDYLRARELEERDAADRSSCMVKDVHIELADLYAETRRDLDARPFVQPSGAHDPA